MRVLILATVLLASSSLSPSFAQQEEKAPVAVPQAGSPAQPDQESQRGDQRSDREQPKADDRQMGQGRMMHCGDGDRMGGDDHEMGHGRMMRRGDGDRMGGDDHEMDHGRMMRRGGGDRMGGDDHEMDHGRMMRRGGSDRMGGDDNEMGSDWRIHREREPGRYRDMDRGRYGQRGDRGWDRADRDGDDRAYVDEDRPQRRVKVCIEYENGDEYCRYRQ